MQITTIGLDIAKNVFAVHGIDAATCAGLVPDAESVEFGIDLGTCDQHFKGVALIDADLMDSIVSRILSEAAEGYFQDSVNSAAVISPAA
jgi:hypothetical protein